MAKEDGIGRYVTAVSGEQVIAKISGETVYTQISGQLIVAQISGQLVSISGAIYAEVSGQIIAKVSGETIIAKISGETIIAKISGEIIVSKISGEVVKISGESIDIIALATVRARDILVPSAGSGGTALASGIVRSVTLKSLSGDVWVGGTTTEAPYSGHGFLLKAGEALSLDVNALSAVQVCANVSGSWVTYISVA